jgi:hypothetical protein
MILSYGPSNFPVNQVYYRNLRTEFETLSRSYNIFIIVTITKRRIYTYQSTHYHYHTYTLIPRLTPQGPDSDHFIPPFSNTLSASLFKVPQLLLLLRIISNSPKSLRYTHNIRKIILTLTTCSCCLTPSLYHSISRKVQGITPFTLVARLQTIGLINSHICILVGYTAIVIIEFQYR